MQDFGNKWTLLSSILEIICKTFKLCLDFDMWLSCFTMIQVIYQQHELINRVRTS